MNTAGKIVIVVVLIAAVGVVIALRQNKAGQPVDEQPAVSPAAGGAGADSNNQAADRQDAAKEQGQTAPPAEQAARPMPKLLDLGAGKCIPCKMMVPILDALKRQYAGRLEVEFIDVWKKPDEAGGYKIRVIPTQIFLDESGKELFRHEGFFPKKDILSKWKELGVDLDVGK